MAGSPKSPFGKLEYLPLEVHLLVSAANVRFATDDRIIDTNEIIKHAGRCGERHRARAGRAQWCAPPSPGPAHH